MWRSRGLLVADARAEAAIVSSAIGESNAICSASQRRSKQAHKQKAPQCFDGGGLMTADLLDRVLQEALHVFSPGITLSAGREEHRHLRSGLGAPLGRDR